MEDERKTYDAEVISNTLTISNKRTPGIRIAAKTEEGETFFGTIWLSYAALENSVKTLQKVFDWKGKNVSEFNKPILKGKKCAIVVEYSDEYAPKIAFFNKRLNLDPLQGEDLDELVENVQPDLQKLLDRNYNNENIPETPGLPF